MVPPWAAPEDSALIRLLPFSSRLGVRMRMLPRLLALRKGWLELVKVVMALPL